jgi:hypothetical protein
MVRRKGKKKLYKLSWIGKQRDSELRGGKAGLEGRWWQCTGVGGNAHWEAWVGNEWEKEDYQE